MVAILHLVHYYTYMEPTSHREQKKIDTRRTIIRVTEDLFLSKGYEATTLQDIATAANVAQRTLFSYFPSKEAIIFDDHQAFIDTFIGHLENHGDESIFDTVRSYDHAHHDHDSGHDPTRKEALVQLIETNAVLQEHFLGMLARLETRFAELTAEQYGLPRDSIEIHLIASSLRSLFQYAIANRFSKNKTQTPEIALNYIEGGIERIQQMTKPKES